MKNEASGPSAEPPSVVGEADPCAAGRGGRRASARVGAVHHARGPLGSPRRLRPTEKTPPPTAGEARTRGGRGAHGAGHLYNAEYESGRQGQRLARLGSSRCPALLTSLPPRRRLLQAANRSASAQSHALSTWHRAWHTPMLGKRLLNDERRRLTHDDKHVASSRGLRPRAHVRSAAGLGPPLRRPGPRSDDSAWG